MELSNGRKFKPRVKTTLQFHVGYLHSFMLVISKHFLDSKQIHTANMLVAPIAPEFSTVDQTQQK